MANQSTPQKTVSDKDYMLALEIIAANTMCTRKAVEVAAKIGKALIVSVVVIVIAAIVLMYNPIDPHTPSWIPIVCWGAIIVFGLFLIIYSLSLLAELEHTTELVSKNEESAIYSDEDED